MSKWTPPDTFSDEDLWAFLLSRPHESFELPQLFSNSIMRRVMSQIREISDKEVKWARYHSRLMWELDQATIRKEQEIIKRNNEILKQESDALKQETEVMKQNNDALKQETEAMKQNNDALKQETEVIKQELEQTEQARLQAEQDKRSILAQADKEKAELLAKIAELENKA